MCLIKSLLRPNMDHLDSHTSERCEKWLSKNTGNDKLEGKALIWTKSTTCIFILLLFPHIPDISLSFDYPLFLHIKNLLPNYSNIL